MTTEERASRLEKLVAPLPTEEWGAPSTSTSIAPPPLSSTTLPTSSDRPARPAKFEAEKYDGASSDSDSSDEAMPGEEGLEEVEEGEEKDEEAPAVMNEDEMLDMGEEMDEFLKFATETLGLSEEQYQGILGERKQRGGKVTLSSHDLETCANVDQFFDSFRTWSCEGKENKHRSLQLYHEVLLIISSSSLDPSLHISPCASTAFSQSESRRFRFSHGADGERTQCKERIETYASTDEV